MTSHNTLQKMTTEFLEWSRWFVFPNVEGRSKAGRHSYPGITDLVAAKGGITLWLEVKVGADELSQAQEDFRDAIIAAGGHWFEVRDNLDGLVRYLDGLRRGGIMI